MRLGGARRRRLRSRGVSRHDRRLCRPQPQHLSAQQPRHRRRTREKLSGRRIPDDARKRQGLPARPRLLQAQPPRPEHDHPVGLLDLARRHLPGRHRAAHLSVRHGAHRRRLHQLSRNSATISIRKTAWFRRTAPAAPSMPMPPAPSSATAAASSCSSASARPSPTAIRSSP